VDTKAFNGVLITATMVEHAHEYLAHLAGVLGGVEFDTSWSSSVIEVRGRADHIAYLPDTRELMVTDAKYGYRMVDVANNWTLISHAIGWWMRNPTVQIDKITFRIYQPRAMVSGGPWFHWSTTMDMASQCAAISEHVLDAPMLTTSQHCLHCKAAATCPAARAAAATVLDVSTAPYRDDLEGQTLAQEMDMLERAAALIKSRLDAMKSLAEYRIRQGGVVPNYALERGVGNRAWLSDYDAASLSAMFGVDLRDKKAVSPAEAERRGVPKELVTLVTERPKLGLKLKRIDAAAVAERAFGKGSS
jgi:hypothetical protein